MDPKLRAWVESQQHLPACLRDFHAQKLFFKWLVWDRIAASRKKDQGSSYTDGLNFVNLQVATIDYTLWFLALCGYRLVKSRKPLPFYDLEGTLREYDQRLMAQQAAVLGEALGKKPVAVELPAPTEELEPGVLAGEFLPLELENARLRGALGEAIDDLSGCILCVDGRKLLERIARLKEALND